jgi:hypothetical protein
LRDTAGHTAGGRRRRPAGNTNHHHGVRIHFAP